jgi:hypothetical protein
LSTLTVGLALAVLCIVFFLVPPTSGAYTATIRGTKNTAGSASYFTCAAAVTSDESTALFAYTLTDASNAKTATDTVAGSNPGTYRGSMKSTASTSQACARDAGGSYVLDGTSSYLTTAPRVTNPSAFSTEVWFKTTTAGGRIVGFGNAQTGPSTQGDRHTYISTTGQLVFGVTVNGTRRTIASPAAVNDGLWHHVVSTMSPSAGMSLWLDGAQVATNATYKTADNYTGYWKIGYDSVTGWPNAGTAYFTGSLRFAAVYTTVLTSTQIQNHYVAGG